MKKIKKEDIVVSLTGLILILAGIFEINSQIGKFICYSSGILLVGIVVDRILNNKK